MRRLTLAALLALALPAVAQAATVGVASYYDDGSGLYAAVPSYRFGDARYQLRVCRADDPNRCVTVTVRDHCACFVGTPDERIIDLSPAAFKRLAPLSAGLVRVVIGGQPVRASVTPPPTTTSTAEAPVDWLPSILRTTLFFLLGFVAMGLFRRWVERR